MNLKELAETVHQANKKWWIDLNTGKPLNRNRGEMLALQHSEISEAFDGMIEGAMDDKIPTRTAHEVEVADCFIRALDYSAGCGYELEEIIDFFNSVEIVKALISDKDLSDLEHYGLMKLHSQISKVLESERKGLKEAAAYQLNDLIFFILIHCNFVGLDLKGAFEDKMNFNRTRKDHTLEARREEGGKKF